MWTPSKSNSNAENSKIKSKLANNKFSIIMKFKDISIPLNDIVNLQPGDVPRLDHNVNENCTEYRKYTKFYGKLGAHKNRYAVKITDIIKMKRVVLNRMLSQDEVNQLIANHMNIVNNSTQLTDIERIH